MTFGVNDSPLAGGEHSGGTMLTGSKLGDRLKSEVESNVSITLNQAPDGGKKAGAQLGVEQWLRVHSANLEGTQLSSTLCFRKVPRLLADLSVDSLQAARFLAEQRCVRGRPRSQATHMRYRGVVSCRWGCSLRPCAAKALRCPFPLPR
jgi:hypothetical protein